MASALNGTVLAFVASHGIILASAGNSFWEHDVPQQLMMPLLLWEK